MSLSERFRESGKKVLYWIGLSVIPTVIAVPGSYYVFQPRGVYIGDLNGDGLNDVAFRDRLGMTYIKIQQSDGTFKSLGSIEKERMSALEAEIEGMYKAVSANLKETN